MKDEQRLEIILKQLERAKGHIRRTNFRLGPDKYDMLRQLDHTQALIYREQAYRKGTPR